MPQFPKGMFSTPSTRRAAASTPPAPRGPGMQAPPATPVRPPTAPMFGGTPTAPMFGGAGRTPPISTRPMPPGYGGPGKAQPPGQRIQPWQPPPMQNFGPGNMPQRPPPGPIQGFRGQPQQMGQAMQQPWRVSERPPPIQGFPGQPQQMGQAMQERERMAALGIPQMGMGGRPPPMMNPYQPRRRQQYRPPQQLNWQQRQMQQMPQQMRQMYNNRPVTQARPMQGMAPQTQRGRPMASQVNLLRNQFGY